MKREYNNHAKHTNMRCTGIKPPQHTAHGCSFRVLAHLGVKLKPSTCFGIVSGAHTYFLAADTSEEVWSFAAD